MYYFSEYLKYLAQKFFKISS